MRQKEEPEMPAPNALLPKLRAHILRRPETRLLQPEPRDDHLAKTQLQHAVAVHRRQSVRVVRPAVLAVYIECLVAQLRHQVRHVVGVGRGVVAVGCGWFVCVPEATQVRGDDGEVWCEQGQQAVPVEAILGRAVEEEDGGSGACGDEVHADAIDAVPVVVDRFAGVVV